MHQAPVPRKKHDTNEERIYTRKRPEAPRTKRRQTDQAEDKARAAAVYDLICRQALHVAKQAEAEALSHIVPTERGLAHLKTLSSISGATGRSEWRLKSTTETSTNFNSRSAEPSSHRQGRPRVPAQAILPSGVRQAARCRRLGPPGVHTFCDTKTTWDETQMGGRRTQLRSKILPLHS